MRSPTLKAHLIPPTEQSPLPTEQSLPTTMHLMPPTEQHLPPAEQQFPFIWASLGLQYAIYPLLYGSIRGASSMSFNRSIDTILSEAQVAIDNSLNNPQVLEYVGDFGYSADRLKKGKALYNVAAAAQLEKSAESGEQISASETVKENWEKAKKTYMRLVKVARVALKKDGGAIAQLDLSGKRKDSLSGWLAQANQFYQNALANTAILSALGEFGITDKKLKTGLNEVKAVESANLLQEKEKGEAQAATQRRDRALDELQDWLSDYLAIAKIALEEESQLLEGLGVLQRA
ncbi:MAG: hypothetical protein AAFZ17_11105 [Cyanobacteria bacterium J06650_10]